MLYDPDRIAQAVEALRSMSSAELSDTVSRLSSDWTPELASTMQTMVWLWNTAYNVRENMDTNPYRAQAR